jgi:hypothetical protein
MMELIQWTANSNHFHSGIYVIPPTAHPFFAGMLVSDHRYRVHFRAAISNNGRCIYIKIPLNSLLQQRR